MCGCDRSTGYFCDAHQRQEKALRSVQAFRFLCEPEAPTKPAPASDYIARIRAGQD